MGFQNTQIICLSDSSEDEDEDYIILPSRRRARPNHENSPPTLIDLDESAESDECDEDESEGFVAEITRERPNSHHQDPLTKERDNELDITSEESDNGSSTAELPRGSSQRRDTFRKVLESMESPEDIQLLYPRSLHPDLSFQEAPSDEHSVLSDFISDDEANEEEETTFEELQMSDFSVYRGVLYNKGFNGQFESLHVVSSQSPADGIFYLDGVIHHMEEKRRIVGAIIRNVNIGGLNETDHHTSKHHIWVQTECSRRRKQCWYRLCLPSTEYNSTWLGFLWLADLNKHVIDYLSDACARGEMIRLHHFETAFWESLVELHDGNQDFEAWSDSCDTDFRMHLTIHASFLRDQAWSISRQDDFEFDLCSHPVWNEIGVGRFVEDQQSSSKHEKTVVTPNIGTAFLRAFPRWGLGEKTAGFNLLSIVPLSEAASTYREARREKLGLPDKFAATRSIKETALNVQLLLEHSATVNQPTTHTADQLQGRVVVVRPLNTTKSRARSYDQQFRFALVRDVAKSAKAVRVIWLTLPTDTICGTEYEKSYYPIPNELFFSDHCNCAPVVLSKIVAAYDASLFGKSSTSSNSIIVELLYREKDASFITPVEAKLVCTCQSTTRTSTPEDLAEESTQPPPTLRNMSLFSGCGTLDYALEESGMIKTVFAIDHNEAAMLSHAANALSERCTRVLGSVNVHLMHFLNGKVAMIEIDIVTAGCPCPGYSLLNGHRTNEKSQRNCSLLASTLSWIELFLPKFVLIENVPQMDHTPSHRELANACAQAICCLVAMGYQVRKMMLTAYNYGSPTCRKRLFIVATAPGVPLPDIPRPTHGHDSDLSPIVTAGDVLKDLAPIHNDTVMNTRDPSHIPIQRLKPRIDLRVSFRNLVSRIPKMPGQGLYQAQQNGLLSREQRKWYYSALSDEQISSTSRTLRRVDSNSPFKTIVTKVVPLDARFGGEILHPHEDRLLSLKEIRRAQGIPDSFLLVGNLRQQIELVGNGVSWEKGVALGRSIREAWAKSCRADTEIRDHDSTPLGAERQLQQELDEGIMREAVEKELSTRDTTESSDENSKAGKVPPNPSRRSQSLTTSDSQKSEEIYEISDYESIVVTPNGNYNYQRSQRGTMTRRTSSAKSPGKPMRVLDFSVGQKRVASPPSSLTLRSKPNTFTTGKDEDIDSDLEFLGSRPVAKKARLS